MQSTKIKAAAVMLTLGSCESTHVGKARSSFSVQGNSLHYHEGAFFILPQIKSKH